MVHTATYVISNRGNKMILHEGYTYTEMKDRRREGCTVTRWACSNRMRYRCRASIRTIQDQIILVKDTHNH
uniref:SFRICE_014283 n=1 Tax=Spodoptera frugiperda TaxID=7108 RepID=A0A2H1WPS0_SPOFR